MAELDIKELIEELVKKIAADEALKKKFMSEPIAVVEKLLGLPLGANCGTMKTADGVEYAIGDFPSADGVTRVRVVCEENVPHWPTPELSRLVVEYFSHFERDPETGESVYNL